MKKPNIILIMTDQQRWDTINSNGFKHMITPNLDNLSKGGITFTSCFAAGSTCISSRAAMFTGMYPHNTGVYSFNRWAHQNIWVRDLGKNGYYTANIGKMHLSPMYADDVFHERFVVENKCQEFEKFGLKPDKWSEYLNSKGISRPVERRYKYPGWKQMLNSVVWEYDEEDHIDSFVGNKAVDWINNYNGKEPFFLQIGFPGPHEPYDPPERFLKMYDNKNIPAPVMQDGELNNKPPEHIGHQKRFSQMKNDSVIDMYNADISDITKMRKHYYANITLIDEKIGGILKALEKRGFLKNSIVIFTSDHGDSLGDHKLPYKWLMYDSMIRVPLIIKDFRKNRNNRIKRTDKLISLMNIGPTILSYAGVKIPSYIEAEPINEYLDNGSTKNLPEYVFTEDNYIVMIRSEKYKLVYYISQEYGELYDMKKDPYELKNLWNIKKYSKIKEELKETLLNWIAESSYFNGAYKHSKSVYYSVRWPDHKRKIYNLI